jgi:hypothetical protein
MSFVRLRFLSMRGLTVPNPQGAMQQNRSEQHNASGH